MSTLTRTSTLKRNSLTVVGSVAMCMAFMGPATSVAFNTNPAAAGAGYALPLSITLSLVACLLLANTIAAFARKLPTSGFAYTFNTRGFGASGGFLSGWLLLLSYGMLAPMLLSAIGTYSSQFLDTQFHMHVAWQVMSLVFGVIVWAINASGVSDSAKAALIFLVIEVGVILGLVGTILGHGGSEGLSLQPFNPVSSLHGVGGLGTGMLWGILMFVGFESVATLGEEAAAPKRTIPIALFSAVILIGLFYVLAAYGAAIGFGRTNAGAFASDTNPWATLSTKYWGISWALVLTVIASQFANFISGTNAVVRVLFSMGRESILPKALGRTSRRQVPQIALTAYLAFGLVFVFVFGAFLDPLAIYGFCGTILGLGMIVIYILISISVIRFYLREHPSEFKVVRHGVLPIITIALMLLPVYGQLSPVPPFPNNLVPYIIVLWMLGGTGYLVYLKRRRQDIVANMGRVFEQSDDVQDGEGAGARAVERRG